VVTPGDSHAVARRRFLRLVAASSAVTGVAILVPGLLRAVDLPHLDASDPTAKALGYVDDASTTTNAQHKAGDACANCQFYSGGPTGYGPCQIFAGKSVNAKGWCVSHSPKK
jgi:hypothetical protein